MHKRVCVRSYNSAQVANLDDYLLRDASYGIESAAIIWGCKPLELLLNCVA